MDTGELAEFDPGVQGVPSHVLVVEDDDDYAQLLGEMLDRNRELPLDATRVASLEAAFAALRDFTPDLILLDLNLPDESGLRTLRRLRDHAPGSAIVVLTSMSEPNLALQVITMGAQEYLVKQDITSVMLVKAIRYAMERWKLHAALSESRETTARERELRQLERLAGASAGQVTADMFGQGRLAQRQPHRYREVREEYERLLVQALRERAYRTSDNASADLRSLASVLGFLNAGPRDVVDLHAEALRHRLSTADRGVHQALVEEGRIRVLELMGYLVSYYRARAIVASRGSTPPPGDDAVMSEDGTR